MLGNIGPLEIGIVLVIALLVFGPKRLPELGGSLGQGIRDFGKGIKGEDDGVAAIEPAAEAEAEVVSAQASTATK
jgi:sec-independent protein translocase protein TatA